VKKKKKLKKKKEKRKKKLKKALAKLKMEQAVPIGPQVHIDTPSNISPLEGKKILKPMTKEEWEKQQNQLKRVFDPDTGRMRLIKGDGEVMEEIVSREQQKKINQKATLGDGAVFQMRSGLSQKSFK